MKEFLACVGESNARVAIYKNIVALRELKPRPLAWLSENNSIGIRRSWYSSKSGRSVSIFGLAELKLNASQKYRQSRAARVFPRPWNEIRVGRFSRHFVVNRLTFNYVVS